MSKEPTSGLALQPIQSDLLSLNIRPAGGPDYNIHELPSLDGKIHKYNSLIHGNECYYETLNFFPKFTHYLQFLKFNA